MFPKTLVIAFLSLGSVLMDSNIKELCSQKYFHSFVANYSEGKTTLQLNRKVDYNEMSYHSWDLLLTEDFYGNYKSTNISYHLRHGQTPNSSLTQPEECAIFLSTPFKDVKWFHSNLSGFQITNDINGPKIHYRHYWLEFLTKRKAAVKDEYKTVSLMSGIWFNGLLCNVSDKSLYAIFEPKNSMKASDRTQFVSRHRLEREEEPKEGVTVDHLYHRMDFFFDPTNKTLFDFLGIDCPKIESKPGFVSTHTLFVVFMSIVVLAAILMIINLILVIKRRRPMIIPNEMTPNEKTIKSTEGDSESGPQKNTNSTSDDIPKSGGSKTFS